MTSGQTAGAAGGGVHANVCPCRTGKCHTLCKRLCFVVIVRSGIGLLTRVIDNRDSQ